VVLKLPLSSGASDYDKLRFLAKKGANEDW
jgi:hypothetical protein